MIFPSTVVSIDVEMENNLVPADAVWTVTETNDGDSDLTNVYAHLDVSTDDDDDGDVATLDKDSANFTGDDGDGVLEPGET